MWNLSLKGNSPDELVDRVFETTGKIPPLVANRPELYPHLQLVWMMFQAVNTSRRVGFGPWFIPISELVATLDLFEVHEIETRLYYIQLLQQMDRTYMDWQDKNTPK